jgi:hypothetical protein
MNGPMMDVIQDVPGGRVSVLGGRDIGHSKQRTIHIHVSYPEWCPRWSYFTVKTSTTPRHDTICKLHCFSSSPLFLLPCRWRRHVPPKRRFIINPHCATSQKTAFFSNLHIRYRENLKRYTIWGTSLNCPRGALLPQTR